MTTSPTTALFKPTGDSPIRVADLAYIKARGRQQAFNLLHLAMKISGISQATLARRTRKPPEVISRILSRPSNLEQDTFSELIFALTGGGIAHRIEYPTAAVRSESSPLDQPTTTNATVDLSPKPYQLAKAA